jgi:hypothetical protein
MVIQCNMKITIETERLILEILLPMLKECFYWIQIQMCVPISQ